MQMKVFLHSTSAAAASSQQSLPQVQLNPAVLIPFYHPLQASRKTAKAGNQEAANPAKGKPSKKGKDRPSFGLGKGTVLMRSLIDSTAPQWTADSSQTATANGNVNRTVNGASADVLSQVVQLAQQLQGGGEEEAGQASVPETLGEPAGALDRRTATQLQQALQVGNHSLITYISQHVLLRQPVATPARLQQFLAY